MHQITRGSYEERMKVAFNLFKGRSDGEFLTKEDVIRVVTHVSEFTCNVARGLLTMREFNGLKLSEVDLLFGKSNRLNLQQFTAIADQHQALLGFSYFLPSLLCFFLSFSPFSFPLSSSLPLLSPSPLPSPPSLSSAFSSLPFLCLLLSSLPFLSPFLSFFPLSLPLLLSSLPSSLPFSPVPLSSAPFPLCLLLLLLLLSLPPLPLPFFLSLRLFDFFLSLLCSPSFT